MADPIVEELALDLTQALRDVDRIGNALTQVAQGFKVDLADAVGVLTNISASVDATAITSGIEEAVVAGSAEPVIVEADAEAVTVGIDQAVGAADTLTAIDADASGITPEIDGAVDAADTTVSVDADVDSAVAAIEAIDVPEIAVEVTADTDAAQANIDALGTTATGAGTALGGLAGNTDIFAAAAGAAVGDAGGLEGVLGKLGPGAVAAGAGLAALGGFIGYAASNAIEAETSTTRFNTALGAMADEVEQVDVRGFSGDISALALLVASSDDAMRNAAASLAEFGRSAGASDSEIAQTAESILLLASRAVALDPALGDAGQVAGQLATALASGRDRALIPFKISLDQAAVSAEAQRRALANGRDTISAWDKIAAGASITAQKLGGRLGTDIVEGSEKAELRQRRLRIQIDETIESLGKPLISPMLEALDAAVPGAEALGRSMGQLAEEIIPAAVPVIEALSLGLRGVATVLEAIPDPVLAGAIAFKTFSVATDAALAGLARVAPLQAAALGPVGAVAAAVGAAAVAFGAFGDDSERAARDAERFGGAIFGAAQSVDDVRAALDGLNESFDEYFSSVVDFGKEDSIIREGLARTGTTYRDLQAAIADTAVDLEDLAEQLVENDGNHEQYRGTVNRVRKELEQERQALVDNARATLEVLQGTGALTKAQREYAIETNTAKDGTVDWLGALDLATGTAERTEAATRRAAVAAAEASGSFDQLRLAIIAGTDVDVDEWARRLQVDAEDIETAIADTQAQMEEFVDSGLAALPTFADAFSDWSQAGKDAYAEFARAAETDGADVEAAFAGVVAATDPAQLAENLRQQLESIATFNANLKVLLDRGLTDLVDELVAQGPIVGGQLAAQLIDDEAVATELEGLVDATSAATEETRSFLRGDAYPRLARAATEVAEGATAGYERGLDLAPGTTEALNDVVDAIRQANPEVTSEAALAAAATDAAFIDRFTPSDGVDEEMAAVGGAINDSAASIAADARTSGFGIGSDLLGGISAALTDAELLRRLGIDAANAAQVSVTSIRGKLGISSPSKVFREIGEQAIEGFLDGFGALAAVEAAAANLGAVAVPTIGSAQLPALTLASRPAAEVQQVVVQFGDIVIHAAPGMTDADARRLGREVVKAIDPTVLQRRVLAAVRTGGG